MLIKWSQTEFYREVTGKAGVGDCESSIYGRKRGMRMLVVSILIMQLLYLVFAFTSYVVEKRQFALLSL